MAASRRPTYHIKKAKNPPKLVLNLLKPGSLNLHPRPTKAMAEALARAGLV